MNNGDILVIAAASFEKLKQLSSHGAEYWSARDLMGVLGYQQWRGFQDAIARAITSSEQAGNDPSYHFAEVRKVIEAGKGAKQEILDYHLSRMACYLIALNGDPRKPEIAAAQQYFAVQTRRQEIAVIIQHDQERIELRDRAKEENRALSGVARNAGVENRMFGVFHNAGYIGLYGGKGMRQVKEHKSIPEKDDILDRMDTTELAANQFRITQAKEKLQRDGIRDQQQAIDAHRHVGEEVRRAIGRIGGTMPEELPPAEHIQVARKRVRQLKKAELKAPKEPDALPPAAT